MQLSGTRMDDCSSLLCVPILKILQSGMLMHAIPTRDMS